MIAFDEYQELIQGTEIKRSTKSMKLLAAAKAADEKKASECRLVAATSVDQAKKFEHDALNRARVMGRVALSVKDSLGAKHFKRWVQDECELSYKTVSSYIKLVQPKCAPEKTGAHLGQRVVEILTAKGVPETALAEAKKRSEAGEKITQAKAKEIVRKLTVIEDKDDHPSTPTSPVPENRMAAAFEAQEKKVEPLTDKQKIAKIMELVASLESPDSQYEVVTQTVALLHEDDRSELFSKLNATYQQDEKQVELFAGDPADLIPPKKINTPEVRKAWGRWCDSNKAKGKPLTVDEGKSQLRLLASGKAETAVERIEYALATRSETIPLAKELPKDFEHPTEEAVVGYAVAVKIPQVEAVDFFRHYVSQGWRKGNGQLIEDWKQSLHAWHKSQGDRNKMAGSKPDPFNEPETPDPRLTANRNRKPRLPLIAG